MLDLEAGAPPRLGLGGFHVGAIEDPDLAIEVVRLAIDSGFELLDNSWDYHDGESERRVGRALADPAYRGRAAVMTKIDSHSHDGVLRQFEESLERLGLDRIDLLQLHEVIRASDADDATERGALRALVELRDQGVVGHIGLTGHKDPAFLVSLIERAEAEGIRLETAQMPINVADPTSRSFRDIALPVCRRLGIAVIGMKPLGAGGFVQTGGLVATDLLRWAMSQPIEFCVTGCESLADVRQAAEVREGFRRMEPEQQAALESVASRMLADGRIAEPYKTSEAHDGTSRHPEWLA